MINSCVVVDKLTTTGYGLDPQYAPIKSGEPNQPRIVGYVARNQVRAETHAIEAVGKLIDAATTAGANRVDGLEFTLEQPAGTYSLILSLPGYADQTVPPFTLAKGTTHALGTVTLAAKPATITGRVLTAPGSVNATSPSTSLR